MVEKITDLWEVMEPAVGVIDHRDRVESCFRETTQKAIFLKKLKALEEFESVLVELEGLVIEEKNMTRDVSISTLGQKAKDIITQHCLVSKNTKMRQVLFNLLEEIDVETNNYLVWQGLYEEICDLIIRFEVATKTTINKILSSVGVSGQGRFSESSSYRSGKRTRQLALLSKYK